MMRYRVFDKFAVVNTVDDLKNIQIPHGTFIVVNDTNDVYYKSLDTDEIKSLTTNNEESLDLFHIGTEKERAKYQPKANELYFTYDNKKLWGYNGVEWFLICSYTGLNSQSNYISYYYNTLERGQELSFDYLKKYPDAEPQTIYFNQMPIMVYKGNCQRQLNTIIVFDSETKFNSKWLEDYKIADLQNNIDIHPLVLGVYMI